MIYTISGDFPGTAIDPTAQIGLGSSKDLCAGVQFLRAAPHFAPNLHVCALRHVGLLRCDFLGGDASDLTIRGGWIIVSHVVSCFRTVKRTIDFVDF